MRSQGAYKPIDRIDELERMVRAARDDAQDAKDRTGVLEDDVRDLKEEPDK